LASAILIGTTYFLEFLAGEQILESKLSIFLIQAGRFIILLLVFLIAYSLIYYLAPSKRGSIPFISPGSIFGSLLSLLVLQVFSFFIDNFGQQNKLYGSLGTIMVILLWVNLNTLAILIGFELNASIYDASKQRQNIIDEIEGS
jgi:membrane protein